MTNNIRTPATGYPHTIFTWNPSWVSSTRKASPTAAARGSEPEKTPKSSTWTYTAAEPEHRSHASVLAGKSKKVQVYPRLHCHTVLEGIAAQKMVDRTKLRWREMLSFEEIKEIASMAEEFDINNVAIGGDDDDLVVPSPK